MLRVHFTAEDLARVTVATRLDPLWETMLGVQQLAYSVQVMPAMQGWRGRAGTLVPLCGEARAPGRCRRKSAGRTASPAGVPPRPAWAREYR